MVPTDVCIHSFDSYNRITVTFSPGSNIGQKFLRKIKCSPRQIIPQKGMMTTHAGTGRLDKG